MNKPKTAGFFKSISSSISRHSPEILVGIGIAGMITTTVLAVGATPKALRLIEEKKRAEGVEKLKPIDTVKTTWKCYIPAAVTGAASIGCLIGANSVHARRNAALAAAYKISETALIEYKDKVIETIGEKKEQLIRDEIDKDHVDQNPVSKNEVIITGRGTTLCYDHLSGRYFYSDIDRLRKAENELNKQMIHDMGGYVSLNDFYDEIDAPHTRLGEDLGWNLQDGLIELQFSSQIAEDGRPCLVVGYNVAPKRDYWKNS